MFTFDFTEDTGMVLVFMRRFVKTCYEGSVTSFNTDTDIHVNTLQA